MVVTWNMARTQIQVEFEKLIRNHKEYNLIILGLQECPRNFKDYFSQAFDAFMNQIGFDRIGHIGMWELELSAYVRAEEKKYVTDIKTNTVACGMMNMVGNKGAV